jgi:hypothetical protein
MKFNIFKKRNNAPLPKPIPHIEPGDFYAVHGACILCGAPQVEAPDLIAHNEADNGVCYFKKQPKTEEEIERAINAIAVSCISGLRYRGKDKAILKRLYEMGCADECDHPLTDENGNIVTEI